jgi:hypothetical protein
MRAPTACTVSPMRVYRFSKFGRPPVERDRLLGERGRL